MQQLVPDQFHFHALLPALLSHSSITPGISISIPHYVGGFVVCIILASTQFVNRLILIFSKKFLFHLSAAGRKDFSM